MKHIDLTIHGKVQGVFFRASTKEKADELGITGFTRNELSGHVYIEAEGEASILQAFVQWCHHGPVRARVDLVEMQEGELKGFKEFVISR